LDFSPLVLLRRQCFRVYNGTEFVTLNIFIVEFFERVNSGVTTYTTWHGVVFGLGIS
jgi:hypothetical protein